MEPPEEDPPIDGHLGRPADRGARVARCGGRWSGGQGKGPSARCPGGPDAHRCGVEEGDDSAEKPRVARNRALELCENPTLP